MNGYILTLKSSTSSYVPIIEEKIISAYADNKDIYIQSSIKDTNYYHVHASKTTADTLDKETFVKLTEKVNRLEKLDIPND